MQVAARCAAGMAVVVLVLGLAACAGGSGTRKTEDVAVLPPASLPTDEAIGTAHPFSLLATAPHGQWVFAEQHRTPGEPGRAEAFLFLAPGPGLRVDGLCATDAEGRFLVVIRDGGIHLLDSRGGPAIRLGPSMLTPEEQRHASPRSGGHVCSFSGDGRRLLYMRGTPGGEREFVLRELGTGREKLLDPGAGRVIVAWLDAAGEWAELVVVTRDGDGDGQLTAPGPCMTSAMCPLDETESRSLRVDPRARERTGDALAPFGANRVRRTKDGALEVVTPAGRSHVWVPASCGAELLRAAATYGVLAVACTRFGSPAPVELYTATTHQRLELWSHGGAMDVRAHGPRFISMPGAYVVEDGVQRERSGGLIDLKRRRAILVGGFVEHAWGPRALLSRRDNRYSLLDADRDTNVDLGVHEGQRLERRVGGVVLAGGIVVDLARGLVLGRARAGALAVDTQGRTLNLDGRAGALVGPARWRAPLEMEPPPSYDTPE